MIIGFAFSCSSNQSTQHVGDEQWQRSEHLAKEQSQNDPMDGGWAGSLLDSMSGQEREFGVQSMARLNQRYGGSSTP
jgi:hypothetical protein